MKQRGFTLIELLLVVAIIGILAGVALPALIGQREKTRNNATAEQAKSVIAEIVHENAFGLNGATIIANITQTGPNPVLSFANAKNPWGGGGAALVPNAAAGSPGQVGMVVGTATAPDGSPKQCINVTYMTSTGGAQATVTVPVPLD